MSAVVKLLRTEAEVALAEQFAAAHPKGAVAWRQEAFDAVAANGLPNRRIEAWHYTDLRSMMKVAAAPASKPSAELAAKRPWSLIKGDDVFSFVDGWLVKQPQLPKGVMASVDLTMAKAASEASLAALASDPVALLNTAFMTSCLMIDVAADTTVTEPVSLAFETTDATASFARVIVNVGEGASITLIETHRGKAGASAQENTVIECNLGPTAKVDHIRVNAADISAQTLSTLSASVAKEASFNTLSFTLGAALSRHQVFARAHGDSAHIGVRGVSLLRGSQHADTTLVVEHDALHGTSRELFKTIVDDEARGVFQGKIIVKPGAQKTDGQMASNALLLGEFSSMHGKPELEIFADDVVCAHGATVGNLDENLLFYLRSRGIPKKEAEALMIQAFAGAALEHVEHEDLRDALIGMTADWLKARK